jgi:hypothetical protein
MARIPYKHGLSVPAPDLPYSILSPYRWRCWVGRHPFWTSWEGYWVFRHDGNKAAEFATRICRVCGKVQDRRLF